MCNISNLLKKCYTCECLGPVLKCECECMAGCAQYVDVLLTCNKITRTPSLEHKHRYCSEKLCSCKCYGYLFRCLDYVCTCQCVIDLIRSRCGANWLYHKCCPCCIPPPPSDPTKRIDDAEVKFKTNASEMFNRIESTKVGVPIHSKPEIASEPSDMRDVSLSKDLSNTKPGPLGAPTTSFVFPDEEEEEEEEEKSVTAKPIATTVKPSAKKKKKRSISGI